MWKIRIRSATGRALGAEFAGSAMLVSVVVGSGIAAQRLSPDDVDMQLLENSIAIALGLAVLILVFGPIPGAHFNPIVSMLDWALGRCSGIGLNARLLGLYAVAQTVGAVASALPANVMFELPAVELATKDRASSGHFVGEMVATAGLILVVFAVGQGTRPRTYGGFLASNAIEASAASAAAEDGGCRLGG